MIKTAKKNQFNASMATIKQKRLIMNRTMRGMQCCCKQESHGDWMATEHNSAVANNLKQKYGEHNYDDFSFYFDNYDDDYLNDDADGVLHKVSGMPVTSLFNLHKDNGNTETKCCNTQCHNDDDDDDKAPRNHSNYDIFRSIWHPLPCCLQKGWNPRHKGWTCRSYQHGKAIKTMGL